MSSRDPIGKRISTLADSMVLTTVVGVVGDVRYNPNTGRELLAPIVYFPAAQAPWRTMTLVVRTPGDPAAITADVQRAIGALDPSLAAGYVASLEHLLSSSLSPQSITTGTLSVFAGIALLLAVIGIYGMMSYTVTQRTHEIGIRMALGAQQDDVVRRVLRHGLKLAVMGMAIGSVASLGLTRGMATLLREISPRDPLTFGAVTAILTRPRCGAARYMAERPA